MVNLWVNLLLVGKRHRTKSFFLHVKLGNPHYVKAFRESTKKYLKPKEITYWPFSIELFGKPRIEVPLLRILERLRVTHVIVTRFLPVYKHTHKSGALSKAKHYQPSGRPAAVSAARLKLGCNRILFCLCVVKNLSKLEVENILYIRY